MRPGPVTVTPDDTLADALRLSRSERIHLRMLAKYGYVVSPVDLPNDTYIPERLKWASWARYD